MTADWFHGWLVRHLERHPLAGLPDMDKRPLFYECWRDEFIRRGVSEAAAEAGSRSLASGKYTKHHHFNALLDLIHQARGAASNAERAAEASKECRECYGAGFASVRDRETRMNFAAYCVCPLGTWKLRKARREAKEGTTLIDLAAIRNGQTYRAVIGGRDVTLDFAEDDDHEANIANLPPGLRRLAESMRPEPEPIHEPDFDYARW